mmetsp:Transcript_110867/g.247504  ORF Transcript_110867/g.247504 Transcript_110867/m.247504 type:complete len:513 (+) Transcript_110867:70-1608(+)
MIIYDPGRWGILYAFSLKGSVFPKALVWATPNAICAGMLTYFFHDSYGMDDLSGLNYLWSGYTFILGILVVFRNNQAYSRFWEGATLISQTRGEWTEAISGLLSFCSKDPAQEEQVVHFQELLVRLFSLLHCSALQQICALEDSTLEVIAFDFVDKKYLEFLLQANDRCEIIMMWIQQLVGEAQMDGTIKTPPPILSRAYQELSRGIVNLIDAKKIKEVPFPFPYSQMITSMLLGHWLITPVLASQVISSVAWATGLCFIISTGLWSLMYIALEIDQPFGGDSNDVDVQEMQQDFNRSLLDLLSPLAQSVPKCTWHSDNSAELARSSTLVSSASTRMLGRSTTLGSILDTAPSRVMPTTSDASKLARTASPLTNIAHDRETPLEDRELKASLKRDLTLTERRSCPMASSAPRGPPSPPCVQRPASPQALLVHVSPLQPLQLPCADESRNGNQETAAGDSNEPRLIGTTAAEGGYPHGSHGIRAKQGVHEPVANRTALSGVDGNGAANGMPVH